MERKTGSGYGRLGQGKFAAVQDGHQSAAVNDREGNVSESGRKIPSNAELKTRLGETEKLSKERRIGKSESSKIEATEKRLQGSRKESLGRNGNNLSSDLQSERITTGASSQEKEKRLARIHHPTRNSDDPSDKSSPRLATRSKINQNPDGRRDGGATPRDAKDARGEEVKRGMNPVENIKILTEKLQEENFFEELIEPRPMIVFNHVCTEEKPEKVTLQEIRIDSRSPSPMLEVPAAKSLEKIIATRPPL